MDTQIRGIHHVTAMTSNARKIYRFFTDLLGLRLIKKTVNQDDIETYHLYFTDDLGTAGTDMTFFDFPMIPKGTKGTNSISRTSFRVPSDAALKWWAERFDAHEVAHGQIGERFGKKYLTFEDFDQQSYQLISDENNTVLQRVLHGKTAMFHLIWPSSAWVLSSSPFVTFKSSTKS